MFPKKLPEERVDVDSTISSCRDSFSINFGIRLLMFKRRGGSLQCVMQGEGLLLHPNRDSLRIVGSGDQIQIRLYDSSYQGGILIVRHLAKDCKFDLLMGRPVHD